MATPSGVALVEVYDLNQGADSKLANLSTRAFVSTGDNIVIAGFLLSGDGINGLGGPMTTESSCGASGRAWLRRFPASAVLADPTLELRDANGSLILANNDWQDNAAQAAEIIAAGLAPTNESRIGHSRDAAAGTLHRAARGTEQRHWHRRG